MRGRTACFDVFDTVLTRRVSRPATVFFLVGQAAKSKGLVAISPADFAAARQKAESECRDHSPTKEMTLAEIYARLVTNLDLAKAHAAPLLNLELAAELEVICLVPGADKMLTDARRTSPRLIFASDMYLPGEFIRERLAAFDCWQTGDRLYVSHEEGCAKVTGLFSVILRKENFSADQLEHTGNNPTADFNAPRQLGIAATLRTATDLNRYEQALETFSPPTHGLASWHAGASRLARLTEGANSPTAPALRAVTAGVVGPLLASYVSWVLRTAREHGLTRLYFVARDGFLPWQLARQLAPRLNPNVELRYLHGSRQAWHLPGIFSLGDAELSWLFCPTDFLSVNSLLARVELSGDALAAELTAAGFARARWSKNLSPAERAHLRRWIQTPAVSALILQRAAVARVTLLAYLHQEGLLAATPCVLIDIGWHGRAHDSLAKVIRSAGFPAPEGFYFGLNTRQPSDELGERHAYFFDRTARLGLHRALPGLEALMEVFCTANQSVTTGYQLTATGAEPKFRKRDDRLENWGWPVLQQTVEVYGEQILAAPTSAVDEDSIRAMCLASLREFVETPTPDEARAWGAFPYEDDQTGTRSDPLASRLEWRQVFDLLWRGRTGPHRAAWWGGSLQLTPPFLRGVLRSIHALRRMLRRLKPASP